MIATLHLEISSCAQIKKKCSKALFPHSTMSMHHASNVKTIAWASYHIRKLTGCACARPWGMLGTFFPPPRVSNLNMHRGTCVTHMPWYMPGSLTSGFLWSRWRGKRSRQSQRMPNPQFYVSDQRPMEMSCAMFINHFDQMEAIESISVIYPSRYWFRLFE